MSTDTSSGMPANAATRADIGGNTVTQLLAIFKEHGIADDTQRQRLAELAPGTAWWLLGLQALAAWLAALCVIGAFALGAMETNTAWSFGILLLAMAMGLFWRGRDSTFQVQLALALSLAGQGLIAFEMSQIDHTLMMPNMLLALALTWPRTSLLHRVVCLLAAFWAGYSSIFPYGAALLGLGLSALAVALWLSRRHWVVWPQTGWPQAGYMLALAHSATLAGLVLLLLFHAGLYSQPIYFFQSKISDYPVYALAAALLWLACVGWLIRPLPGRERACLMAAAVLLAVLAYGAPGVLVCLALLLATFHACQRAWVAGTLLCALLFLGIFYYHLQQTLLMKSALLAGAGVLLLALGGFARHARRKVT